MSDPHTFVLIDTEIWSHLYLKPKTSPHHEDLEQQFRGRSLAIVTQTRAELLGVPEYRRWGDRRREDFLAHLDVFPTIPVTDPVVRAFSQLKVESRQRGHPLHEKIHTADCWIAATTRAHSLPLMSLDKVFRDAPGLTNFN